MIFFQKKKKKVETTGNKKFDFLVEKYGYPSKEGVDGGALVDGFGRAHFPTGEQFVIDAKTGKILTFNESVRYVGVSRGLHFYLHKDNDLLIGDKAKASF